MNNDVFIPKENYDLCRQNDTPMDMVHRLNRAFKVADYPTRLAIQADFGAYREAKRDLRTITKLLKDGWAHISFDRRGRTDATIRQELEGKAVEAKRIIRDYETTH